MNQPAASLAIYSNTAKFFHWFTAVAFVAQFPIGITMVQLPSSSSLVDFLPALHRTLGFLMLWLALIRLAYRMFNPVQRIDSKLAGWHRSWSFLIHRTIYGLLVLVPLTGWIGAAADAQLGIFFGLHLPAIVSPQAVSQIWFFWVHGLAAFTLAALVAIHIAFALQGYLDGPSESADAGGTPASVR